MYHTLYSPFGPSKMGEQKNAVRDLEKMISNHPTEQKYRDALEEYKNKLYKEYRKRVEDRMVFLRSFYSDMYKLSNKEFTKKYKKHCDKELIHYMNRVQLNNTKIDGYQWFVFSDMNSHKSQDFKFQYMDNDPRRVGNPSLAMMLYKDSVKSINEDYRFNDAEDKWYKVNMGENFAMIKVEGEKNRIKVKELINPSVPFIHRTKDVKIIGIRDMDTFGD